MTGRSAVLLLAACSLPAAACGGSSSSTPPATTTPATQAPTATAGSQSAGGAARVTIDPTHGRVGTVVHVSGSGYAPGVALSGTLCAVDAAGVVGNPLSDCDILDLVTVTTDASGAFRVDYTVKAIPPAKAGYQIGFGKQDDPTQSGGAAFTVDG